VRDEKQIQVGGSRQNDKVLGKRQQDLQADADDFSAEMLSVHATRANVLE
jgi:hypothetical protein